MSAPLFSRLVATLFARPVSRRARRRAGRLGMECLEDRTVPDGSFSGRLWLDADADGVQDSGEPGVAGALVEAFDNSWSVAASTTTDADGYYTVTGVPDDSCNGRYTLPSGTPYQFWYYGSGATDTYYPTYVGATIDLPVYGPPAVSVAALGDAIEGGALGSFRFTRTGDTSSSLTATYSVLTGEPNYATNGDDIEELSGTVIIPAGWAYQDVSVLAWADNNYDPDETVMISVQPSPNYTRLGDGTAGLPVIDTSFVVTTTADTMDTTDNKVSLREALFVANGIARVNYRTISFNFPGTTGTINLNWPLPQIEKSIYIAGPADRGVTIAGPVQHLEVLTGAELKLAGLKFLNGVGVGSGGAVLSRGVLTIVNCEFRGNTAQDGGAIAAGASLDHSDASLTITDCDINGNYAYRDGGGVYTAGIPVSITNTTIGLNTALLDGGGVAFGLDLEYGRSSVSLSSVQILGNVARRGGGVWARYTILALAGGTNVEGNVAIAPLLDGSFAESVGGGLYVTQETGILLGDGGARFASNQATTGRAIYMDDSSWLDQLPVRAGGDEGAGGIVGGIL